MIVTIGLTPDSTRERIRESRCFAASSGPESAWPPVLSTAVDILCNAPLPMLLLWGDEQIAVHNQAFARLAGERETGLFGKPARQAWPQLWPWSDETMPRVLPLPPLHLADGRTPFTLYFTPLHAANGAMAGVLATAIESQRSPAAPAPEDDAGILRMLHEAIASQKMAADAERHARADEGSFLRSLFEQTPGFTAVLRGPEHVFTVANAPYRELVGRDDIIGKPVREALPEVVEQGFLTLLDQAYATGEPYVGKDIQLRLNHGLKGERTVLLDFVYQPIRDGAGAVAGIFVQGLDVTEHRTNSERLRIAQEAGGIGSFEWFPDTDRMVCSDTYRQLWGLPENIDVTGSMLVAMVNPEYRHEVGPVKLGVQENPLEYAEYQITRADNGEKRWLARRGKVVERNGTKRYLGVAFDITHRKQTDLALRDSEARIQQTNEFIRLLLDSTEEGF